MPNVSVSLSESAYEGYKSIPKGERSRVASKAFLAHNHAAHNGRIKYVQYEDEEGELVKVPLAGKSIVEIMDMMGRQMKLIDAMRRELLKRDEE
jgi:hypothetical protein